MKKELLFFLCFLSVCAGMFYLAINRGFIVMNLSSTPSSNTQDVLEKKSVKLMFWHRDHWQHEKIEIIWSTNQSVTVKHIIDAWLTLMDEERIMEKKVSLQTACASPSEQELFLSFDRNPFSKEASTYDKWMWVEGILKTLRENGIKYHNVRFLVHHQNLNDYHLDFSNPWPMSGFIK